MPESIEVSKPITVEFYPSLDDYAYVATSIHNRALSPPIYKYATYAFLLVNLIAFPAYLFFTLHLFAGVFIFVLNFVIVNIFLPQLLRSSVRDFYERHIPERENKIAVVELSESGVRYWQDDIETYYAWKRFTNIEETADSIFFFYSGNGFGVRKSGFAYRQLERDFYTFAYSKIVPSRPQISGT